METLRNIYGIYLFTFLNSLGRGIWLGNVLSAYIYFLANQSYSSLGIVSSITGFASTIILFPAGYLTDRFPRVLVLYSGAVFGIISLIILWFTSSLNGVIWGLFFWGLFNGSMSPSTEALFADSIVTGNRSPIYTKRYIIQQVAMAVGPFLNIASFLYLGDNWSLPILKAVMNIGISFSALAILSLFLVNDKFTMGRSSESIDTKDTMNHNQKVSNSKVPYILLSANLIVGIGAGMTIRYFQIFFLEIYKLFPVGLNLLMGVLFVVTALAGHLAQKVSTRWGRPQIIFTVQMLGTICLFLIALYPPLSILVIIFLLRGSLMNAAQPLSRSILMDYIPKKSRGKWNAAQFIAWGLFWNLSAIIGGFLIEQFGYRINFLITAGIYVIGTLPILLLFSAVPKESTPKISPSVHAVAD